MSPIILLVSFRIFSKIREDIRNSRCKTTVNDTGEKVIVVNDAVDKFDVSVNDTGDHHIRPLGKVQKRKDKRSDIVLVSFPNLSC